MSRIASATASPRRRADRRPIACAMRSRRRSFASMSARCALNLTTAGRNIALSVPWCSFGLTPPRLWLRLCTQPRPFWNAIAPCMLALIMFKRASRSLPSRVARSMCAQRALQAVEARCRRPAD